MNNFYVCNYNYISKKQNVTKTNNVTNKNIQYFYNNINFCSIQKITKTLNDGTKYWIEGISYLIQKNADEITIESEIPMTIAKKIPKNEFETWIRNSVKFATGAKKQNGIKKLKGKGINGYGYEVKLMSSPYRLLGKQVINDGTYQKFIWEMFENTH